jgi:16S rRNA (guanine1516-N2)-methyltransferase
LSLKKAHSREHGVSIDFFKQQKEYQRQKLSRKKDLLARAIGIEDGLRVCDLTLGLAGDAFKLAYLGAKIYGYEENPWVGALVINALWRAQNEGLSLALEINRCSFVDSLSKEFLRQDVFYMDPMYAHDRTALPRKEMQYLAEIVPPTDEALLANTVEKILTAKKKLVIKRAPQSPPLANIKPHRSVEGKMVRFDIYGK